MTPSQLQTLKEAIAADATLNAFPNSPDAAFEIAAALNLPFLPTFYVWRRNVDIVEIMGNGFAWDRVDNASVGKARIWDWMTRLGIINPSQANVRAGILAAFPANPADQAMRLAIFSHCQETASRFEKLYASGAGTTTTFDGVGPGTRGLLGPITYQEVFDARSLP